MPEDAKESAAKFLLAIFDHEPCPNDAAFLGPDGQALCASCAAERKNAHESGQTIMSMLLKAQHGHIPPFTLTPIQ